MTSTCRCIEKTYLATSVTWVGFFLFDRKYDTLLQKLQISIFHLARLPVPPQFHQFKGPYCGVSTGDVENLSPCGIIAVPAFRLYPKADEFRMNFMWAL